MVIKIGNNTPSSFTFSNAHTWFGAIQTYFLQEQCPWKSLVTWQPHLVSCLHDSPMLLIVTQMGTYPTQSTIFHPQSVGSKSSCIANRARLHTYPPWNTARKMCWYKVLLAGGSLSSCLSFLTKSFLHLYTSVLVVVLLYIRRSIVVMFKFICSFSGWSDKLNRAS